jgi:hypothetical protein
MTLPAQGTVLVRLPADLVDETLFGELSSARVLSNLRGSTFGDMITVLSDVVGITSGFVTIGLAYDQIGALAKQIIDRLSRRHETQTSASPLSIEIDLPGGSVILTGDNEEIVSDLIKILQRVARGRRPDH